MTHHKKIERYIMIIQNVAQRTAFSSTISLFDMLTGIFLLLFVSAHFLNAQTTDHWPKPSVALYDCNWSAVTTDTTSQKILNSSSRMILRNILSDTTSNQVFLFSFGLADTTATDPTSSGNSFTMPDSGAAIDANYVIASKIVGTTGSYTLTVSIQDGHTYTHIVDGTATFNSITDNNMKSACLSAVQQILPLTTYIRSYHGLLKQANPSLSINPQINLSPVKSEVPLNGSTDVVITVIDCDGAPLANRQLTLDASYGSFNVSTVQTDNAGNAVAVFTAGNSKGIANIAATIQNTISVTSDTIYPRGSEAIIVGDVETARLWVMEFEFNHTGSGYFDELKQVPGGTGWQQNTSFWDQNARGKFFCIDKSKRHDEMNFTDTNQNVSGRSFSHEFSKYSGPSPDGSTCPEKYWYMNGKSWTYYAEATKENKGEASFEYDPINNYEHFYIVIPYSLLYGDSYVWYSKGEWDHGTCNTTSEMESGHSKGKITTSAGIISQGDGTIGGNPGLVILPFYNADTICGYTIIYSKTTTYVSTNGEFSVNMDKFFATVKPYSSTKTAVKEETEQPRQFSLSQNYPNPFNPNTTISFDIPTRSHVTLKIYDLLGREVAALVTNEIMPAGSYTRQWNAEHMSSGIYFYRLQSEANYLVRKLVLVK
jgi:hypothetical protein